jgi:hypothetical protein
MLFVCRNVKLVGLLLFPGLLACGRTQRAPLAAPARENARLAMAQPQTPPAKQNDAAPKDSEDPDSDAAARAYFKRIAEDRDRARRALKLVDAEQWEEAAALLEQLSDVDFRVPRRREIRDILPDGRLSVEWIPEHAIGHRRAALVRCYYHLGRVADTRPYVWPVIEDDHFESACFRAIIDLNSDDLGSVARRAGAIVEADEKNRTAKKLLQYVDLVRLLNNERWEMAIAVITSGCSCPPDKAALSGKEAYDRLAAETIADRGAKAVAPLIAALQPSPEEVHLCVVHALSRTADRRALEALQSARSRVRNYQAGKRLDAAIEYLRQQLE